MGAIAMTTVRLWIVVCAAALAACGGASPRVKCTPQQAPTLPTATSQDGKEGAPEEVGPSAEELAEMMKRAEEAMARKDYANARALVEQVVQFAPQGYPYAYVIAGDIALAHPARAAEALAAYDMACTLDPSDGWAQVRASAALLALGRRQDARARLTAFAGAHADTGADVLNALGWMELNARDTERARRAFEQAHQQSGGKDGDALYGLAIIAANNNDAKEAVRLLGDLLAIHPERREEVAHDEIFAALRDRPALRALLGEPPKVPRSGPPVRK